MCFLFDERWYERILFTDQKPRRIIDPLVYDLKSPIELERTANLVKSKRFNPFEMFQPGIANFVELLRRFSLNIDSSYLGTRHGLSTDHYITNALVNC